MARVLGEARVSVLPDGTRFKPEAEAQLKKATAGMKAAIPIALNSAEFNARVKEIKAKIADLQKSAASVSVDLNDKAAVAKMATIKAQLEQLSRQAPNISLNVDAAKAEAALAKIDLELDKFSHKRVTATADVNTNTARSKLSSFTSFIAGRFSRDMGSAGGNAGDEFGNGFVSNLGKSAIFQNPGITGLVIAGLGALPAAVGAIGVLGGIALGAGIMYGAEKLLKSQLKSLTTEIKQETTILNSKSSTPAEKKAAEDVIKQDQAQVDALNKQVAAFAKVNDAVNRLKLTFQNFAVVVSKPLIQPFATALNDLSNELKGPLETAFTGLFKAVAPLVPPVLSALLEIVEFALPGLTKMLNAARGPLIQLFAGFGRIVGLKLSDWFKTAAPYIQASSTYFLKLVGALGSAVTWLIKFGGETAKAFGDPALKGFGPLIEKIGSDIIKLIVPAFQGWIEVMAPVTKLAIELLVPLLNFLVANPALVKAITGMAAAWLIAAKAIAVVNVALKLLDIEALANPWVALAAAIVLATVLIVKYWKPISAFFAKIWHDIYQGFVSPLVNFFTETVPHAFDVTLNWIKKNWPLLASIIGGPLGAIVSLVITHWNTIFNATKSIWGNIENVITGVFKPVLSVVGSILKQLYQVFVDTWHAIAAIVKVEILIVVGLIGQAWRGILNLSKVIWTGVQQEIVHPLQAAWAWVSRNFLTPIEHGFQTAWNAIASWTSNTFSGIYKHVTSFLSSAWNWTNRNFLTPIEHGFQNAWNAISNWTTNTFSYLYKDTTQKLAATWNWTNRNFLTPIAHGFQDAWNHIASWTKTGFQDVYNYIITPLTKAAGWIGNFFVKSIKSAFSGLVNSVKAIWNGLKKVVADPINFVGGIWNKFANFVNGGLKIFGIGQRLPPFTPIKFAKGGKVPGYAPGKDIVPAMLSPGEFVIRPEAAKAIGHKTLETLNKFGGTHPTFPAGKDTGQKRYFANGGASLQGNQQILADAEKYNGHKYVWGGPANPTNGWDCSSFVGYVLGHDFGLRLPGGVAWNPNVHGPVASAYNNMPNFLLVSHNVNDIEPGDLLVENSGGHVGFGAGPNRMFSAYDTASGTLMTNAANMTNIYRNRGPLSPNGPLTALIGILKKGAALALSGVEGLVNGAMNHIPGTGPIPQLAKVSVDKIMNAAIARLNGNPNNYTAPAGGTGGAGPAGGATGSEEANGIELYQYLLKNLFGGHKIAAAGAIASIWGESNWNPFAQGSGGRGLIGWTPPSTISDADFSGGMKTQEPAILRFVTTSGDSAVIAKMFQATSVNQAAQEWGQGVERYGINDVHSQGVALATQIMNTHASGGLIKEPVIGVGLKSGLGYSFGEGGRRERVLTDAQTQAYEHRFSGTTSDGRHVSVSLELPSTGNEFDQFLVEWLRKKVRIKGAGDVQRAFGRRH